MATDTLIIADVLVEPPTDSLALRTVTMMSHVNLGLDVLLHTSQVMSDLYYHWMKPRGLMDYIADIINEQDRVSGIRVDVQGRSMLTIVVKSICFENQLYLLGQIKARAGRK
jgi:hypothetical protein